MENPNTQINSSKINLSELRLPANYGATLGVKKVVNSVYVGKPKKSQFFQVHNSLETKYLKSALLWTSVLSIDKSVTP